MSHPKIRWARIAKPQDIDRVFKAYIYAAMVLFGLIVALAARSQWKVEKP